MLDQLRAVDLTQALGPDTVMWPGAPQPAFQTILTVSHDGFYNRLVTFVEHTATHFDAPCHMVEGKESVDQIGAERLFRPLAMIDISAEVGDNADAILQAMKDRRFADVGHILNRARLITIDRRAEFDLYGKITTQMVTA